MKCGLVLFLFTLLVPAGKARAQNSLALPSPVLPAEQSGWLWSGDLRLRQQRERTGTDDPHLLTRLRARVDVQIPVDRDLRAEIRLATSKSNRSQNQTLGDGKDPGSPRRFIGLDLAFAEWTPLDFWKLDVGRIPQVHFHPGGSQALLDDDLALEGAAMVVDSPLAGDWHLIANAGSALIRENYDSYYMEEQTDNSLNWGQVGLLLASPQTRLTFGFGFFNYTAVQGKAFSDLTTGATADGNSQSPAGFFKNNYVPRQGFIEVLTNVGSYSLGAFSELIENTETTDPHRATWSGFSVGQKLWEIQLAYGDLDSDSVPALFTNSDYCNGTTDCRGYQLSARYKMAKNFNIKMAWMDNQLAMTTNEQLYQRFQLDLNAIF